MGTDDVNYNQKWWETSFSHPDSANNENENCEEFVVEIHYFHIVPAGEMEYSKYIELQSLLYDFTIQQLTEGQKWKALL